MGFGISKVSSYWRRNQTQWEVTGWVCVCVTWSQQARAGEQASKDNPSCGSQKHLAEPKPMELWGLVGGDWVRLLIQVSEERGVVTEREQEGAPGKSFTPSRRSS